MALKFIFNTFPAYFSMEKLNAFTPLQHSASPLPEVTPRGGKCKHICHSTISATAWLCIAQYMGFIMCFTQTISLFFKLP